jgi:pyruvate/2-oxoglutarate dehydrogenase complex dihydrolipoamide acyltransferase (E2) component
MSTEIRIPSLGVGMSSGILTEWLVEDGARVAAGQLLYCLESEKSVQEIESPADGVLRVVGELGVTYDVGELIAHLE